jgi:hypothetical protein
MHALTKHEVLLVSGGDETVSDIPFPTDGDYTPPPTFTLTIHCRPSAVSRCRAIRCRDERVRKSTFLSR